MLYKGFIPSTGFGHKASLDASVRPFLGRVGRMAVVDYLARSVGSSLPRGVSMLMSPGSSRALLRTSAVRATSEGLGELGWNAQERPGEDAAGLSRSHADLVWLTPQEVLKAQVERAAAGWALDFACHEGLDEPERRLRTELTLVNAEWARAQDVGDLDLWGGVVGWDPESFANCARLLAKMGYRTLVVCGLWSWIQQPAAMGRIVESVREAVAPDIALHVNGIGSPDAARRLGALGIDSLDGAAYVRAADRGVQWDEGRVLADSSQIERTHMAIANAKSINEAMQKARQAYAQRRLRTRAKQGD